ncbi:helix-turn-helix domain-containing protein [Paenochrobactrum glaciei]
MLKMLESGQSWNSIIQATGCSRSTLSRIKNQIL